MSDDLAKAVAAHVEREVAGVRERLDSELDKRMEKVWKELDQRYRSRIAIVLAAALAVMVGGFAVSAITATREANNAVIEFQNSIIARQKAMIESEDRVSAAAARLNVAEGSYTLATKKLESASSDLNKVTGELAEAKRRYEELSKLPTSKK